jgi:hypothetical protein
VCLDEDGPEAPVLRDRQDAVEQHSLADAAQPNQHEALGVPPRFGTRKHILGTLEDGLPSGKLRRLIADAWCKRASEAVHL